MDKLNQSIHKLYNKNGLMQKYGGEVFISVLVIFIVGIIFVYLQVLNNIEPVKKNWGTERCNPFIIPLAGFINNTDKKNKSDQQYTLDNFEFCLGNIITASYSFVLDSFKFILSGIMNMFQDIFTVLKGLISWIMSLISWILGFLENIWGLTLQNVTSLQKVLNKIRDSFSRMVGIVVVTLYINMILFRLTIMWMITTPIFIIFNNICEVLVKLLMWCLKNQAITMLKWSQLIYCVATTTTRDTAGDIATADSVTSGITGAAAVVEETTTVVEETTAAPLLSNPFTAIAGVAEMAAGIASGILAAASGVASTVAAAGATVGTTINAALWSIGIAGCGTAITTLLYQAYSMIMIMIDITVLVLSVTLIYLLWEFNKAVLGGMNIPGQGIPGLSF